jgi:two-component sensor histidine kinase
MSALAEKEVVNLIKEAKEKRAYNIGDLYLYLAYLNRYEGNLADALEYALAAEKNLRANTNAYKESEIYWELALTYDELNQPENSIYWFKKCIESRENKNASQYVIYRTYYLMVVQMIKSGQANEAFELLQKTRQKNPPASPTANAILSQCLAYCFNAQSRFTMAEKYFLSMIKSYSEEVQDTEVLLIANYDVGKFYVDRNQYNKAGPYVEEAFRISNNTTIGRLKDLYLLRFKIDSANGIYTSAIEQFQQYKILNDSIFNIAKTRQIEELMIKYETEKKENNISILQKENLLQQKSLKQAAYTRNYILTGIALLLLIVGLIYNRYWNKQQTNLRLEAKQKEIENQNLSLHHLVKEKEWLVKEIHHRVKNNLHTIIGLLHTQSAFLKTEEALLAINESQHRIQAMSLIHEKLFQSGDLSTVEMSRYMRELADYLKHSFNTGQRIVFKLDAEELELKLSHSLPIGLILNEAITNAIKYAFPENGGGIISVSLRHKEGPQYQLTIADNGKGLPESFDFKKSNSMGMNLMEGLSEDMQGSFSIKNDNGTTITVLFLYDASVADDLLIQQNGSSSEIN